MVWTALALVLWVVLGGFISYYGDLQGRRWGKRRVSWFGLRPKHTAILITSLTGGFIALFSVASLMIIAPTVRDVVTHGENAIQDNKRLIADETKQQLIDKASDRENQLKLQATNKALAEGSRKVAEENRQLSEARASLAPLKARLGLLTVKISSLQVHETTLAARIKQLGTQIASEDVINKQLASQNLDLGHQNGELVKSNSLLQSSSNTLKQQNATLSHIGDGLKLSNDQLYNNSVTLEKRSNELEKERNEKEKRVAELTSQQEQVLDLIHQRDLLNAQLQDISSRIVRQYAVLRQGNVILRAGVELGRISMDAHLRPEAIKKQVVSLIASASDQAKRFGASADEGGQAASLLPQQKVTLTGYENTDEDAQVESLAQGWSGQDVPYVVVATTVTNCLAGEPAFVDLHRYPVVRVFAKGAEVASRIVDGHSKVDDIINNLMAFLQKDVQKSALHAGIIPRVDPETGISEVGVLGTADLFRLTDTVRRMRGPVLLTARARQNVSSADRLDLTFKVSRLPSQPQSIATD